MKNLISRLFLVSSFANFIGISNGSTYAGTSNHTPQYQTYQGQVIDARTIGSLALAHQAPEHDALVIKKWRDENKALLVGLTDFTYKNSDYRAVFNTNKI